jgi:hypothetical protein
MRKLDNMDRESDALLALPSKSLALPGLDFQEPAISHRGSCQLNRLHDFAPKINIEITRVSHIHPTHNKVM